ncbi:hypothetical protein [Lysinibacillus parviboronicapiens]|uniref:hypothetical protein n=1 Tax=Lysinibacillus parviboronicapiens TaxID=436516 RepID=UPI0012905D4E|nr:hypothetical protein [Lysinibacillus parviboronicapiens]
MILINDVTFATKLCRAFQRIKNSTGYTSSGILVVIGTIIFFIYVAMQLESEPETQNLSSSSNSSLSQTFSLEKGDVVLDSKWLSLLEKRGGWLQVLDPQGRMLASSTLPSHYEPGQLVSYWQKSMSFPYELTVSQEEKLIYPLRKRVTMASL